jgi:hypothetical protein
MRNALTAVGRMAPEGRGVALRHLRFRADDGLVGMTGGKLHRAADPHEGHVA